MAGYYGDAAVEDVEIEDDTWLEDDDYSGHSTAATTSLPQQVVSQQEWDKLYTRYSDAGYREGITAGKASTIQQGFDQGFSQASSYGRDVGMLRGIASTLLALLTTSAGAKHAAGLGDALADRKAQTVVECRAVVTALGKLDEAKVLPVDEEARAHAAEHDNEGLSQEMLDRKEMRSMEAALDMLGGGKKEAEVGLDECKARLAVLLKECGMEGVIPFRG